MSPKLTISVGVSWWNRATVRALLGADGNAVMFIDSFEQGLALARRERADLVGWASKITRQDKAAAIRDGVALVMMEDGFLRSVGLGAGLARGGSYVLDRSGIYYDSTAPSDLETLLETAEIGPDETSRAGRLRETILAAGISKYNVGKPPPQIAAPIGRERILVVGQVAVDAGVRRTLSSVLDCAGSPNINLDLLRAVREANPRAFVVYKPHPDVEAGLRPGRLDRAVLARLADQVVADADVIGLIRVCDRLATVSSLSGFEALLRGKPVSVYGLPFYAGWGLTDDLTKSPRRTRRLGLDELVAGALLRYCRYVDPVTLRPCTVEALIARIAAQRADPMHRLKSRVLQHLSWAGRKLGL